MSLRKNLHVTRQTFLHFTIVIIIITILPSFLLLLALNTQQTLKNSNSVELARFSLPLVMYIYPWTNFVDK